jgi:hypothetical protein
MDFVFSIPTLIEHNQFSSPYAPVDSATAQFTDVLHTRATTAGGI